MNNDTRTVGLAIAPPGKDTDSLLQDFLHYFSHTLGRDRYQDPPHYEFIAVAMTLRDRLMVGSNNTRHHYEQLDSRRVCYLSMEYLLGRSLRNATLNLDLDQMRGPFAVGRNRPGQFLTDGAKRLGEGR